MNILANDYKVIYETPKTGEKMYAFTPAIWVMENGCYIFTNDIGGADAGDLPEAAELIPHPTTGRVRVGHIYTSDDKGETWHLRANRNFTHARPFEAGGAVYVLGQCGDLVIYCSRDGGNTWDSGHYLTQGENWHSHLVGRENTAVLAAFVSGYRQYDTSGIAFQGAIQYTLR